MNFDALVWQQWVVLAVYVLAELADIAIIDPSQARRKPSDTLARTFWRAGMIALVMTI